MIAAYFRLSQADEDIDDIAKAESNSITNQRKVVMDFIAKQADLRELPVQEFVDDGYSGTNMNRPAFQEMLEYVKQGKIKTIVVKDFSRFARDYIEAGDYLERIFPFLGVRFIAIHDYYDSASHLEGSLQDMEIVIKNIINTAYSRDLSAKLASTHKMRRNRQQYSVGYRPFGFATDPADYTVLAIDPVSGEYVRLIFQLAIEGKKTKEIAQILNERGIPTPAQYLLQKKTVSKDQHCWNMDGLVWTPDKVYNILSNEKYKGTFVARKIIRLEGTDGKKRKNNAEDILRVENAHAAIVSPEEFEEAQQVIHRKTDPVVRTIGNYPLRGKVVCGCCGRKMNRIKGKHYNYFCCRYAGCSVEVYQGKSISEKVLGEVIFHALSAHLILVAAASKLLHNHADDILRTRTALENKRQKIMEAHKVLMAEKAHCYEAYADGRIVADEFAAQKKEFETKAAEYARNIQKINDELKTLVFHSDKKQGEMEEAYSQVSEKPLDQISIELAVAFIDRILVYGRERIEIVWKYDDVIRSALEEK